MWFHLYTIDTIFILTHGIDIAISSPGTDELGRAGITGIVDNKIANELFSSIMLADVSMASNFISFL